MSMRPCGPGALRLLVASTTTRPFQSATGDTASAVRPQGVAKTTTSAPSTASATVRKNKEGSQHEDRHDRRRTDGAGADSAVRAGRSRGAPQQLARVRLAC